MKNFIAFTIFLLSQSGLLHSQSIDDLLSNTFKGESSEIYKLQNQARLDSIVIGNQPQTMSVVMTDVSEVRLDSTFILSSNLNSKTKSIYNDEGRVIRILRYTNTNAIVGNSSSFYRLVQGIDSDGITLSITNDEISIPDGYEINSAKISNFSIAYGGTEVGCYYSEAIVEVTGGVQDGMSVQGCGTDFNNLDVTGFSSINVTSVDIDNWPDVIDLSFEIVVEISTNNNDVYDFNLLTSETNFEYDSNGNTILEENIYYNPENGEVAYLLRDEFTFNSDNNILTFKQYTINSSGDVYLQIDQERSYDENGYYIVGQQFSYNGDGAIIYGLKYEFTRDSDGLWYYRTAYEWDNNSGFFLVSGESEIARFENFETDITLNFNGSTSLETLFPSSKNIFTRDGFNSVSVDYNWDTNTETYLPSQKTYYDRTYFDDGVSLETYESATSSWNTETNSFEYLDNLSSKINRTYDINGRQVYQGLSIYSTDNLEGIAPEFITYSAIERQYDDNGNMIFYKTSEYRDGLYNNYLDIPLGSWISSSQQDLLYNDNGFISQRLYSSGSYQNSETEYVSAYFKDDYSTILDSETNFIRMGTPSLSEDGAEWQEMDGSPFKSYYWYTQNSSLSTGEDSGSRIGLFPNPTDSVLFLNTNIPHKIEVYDLGGRKIIESIGVEIDISSLSNATYVVKIIDIQSDEFVSKKIIKE